MWIVTSFSNKGLIASREEVGGHSYVEKNFNDWKEYDKASALCLGSVEEGLVIVMPNGPGGYLFIWHDSTVFPDGPPFLKEE